MDFGATTIDDDDVSQSSSSDSSAGSENGMEQYIRITPNLMYFTLKACLCSTLIVYLCPY